MVIKACGLGDKLDILAAQSEALEKTVRMVGSNPLDYAYQTRLSSLPGMDRISLLDTIRSFDAYLSGEPVVWEQRFSTDWIGVRYSYSCTILLENL